MRSSKQKRAALFEKLQQLGALTNSTALSKTSIIADATKYILELKQKVERMNDEGAGIGTSQDPAHMHQVTVETLEKGFHINVSSEKSSGPELLVAILEAMEELNLDVLDARVSCAYSFELDAVVGQKEEEGEGHVVHGLNAARVKQAVLQAINK